MPVDYGRRLTAKEKAELKRVERARKRAGQPKVIRPADTGRDKAEIARRAVTPGVGDTAREKSRVAVQGRARDAYEKAIVQPVKPTPQSRAEYRKAQRALRTSLTDLTPGERQDFSGFTRARSEQNRLQTEKELRGLFPTGARIVAAAPSFAVTGNVDPFQGVKDVREFAQRMKATLMDPEASRREKLEAALNTTAMAGIGGGVGRPNIGTHPRAVAAQAKAPKYRTKPLDEGEEFFNQTGERFPKSVADTSKPYDNLDYDNLYDDTGNMIGSIAYDARPGRDKIYVESVYIDPKHRGLEPLRALTQKIVADGRPIDATFDNKKLGRLFDRMVERARVQQAAAPKTPAEELVAGLPEAKVLRRQQDALATAERRKRIQAAKDASEKAGGGIAGHEAAKRELRGALPKLKYGKLENFDENATKELLKTVQAHPDLGDFDKIYTSQAILDMIQTGRVPRPSEIKFIETVFGPEVAKQIVDSAGFWYHAREVGFEFVNVPRALKSSFDLSAPFRQGLVLGARHPAMFAKQMPGMVKAAKDPQFYKEMMAEIETRPNFPQMRDSGLALTDLTGPMLKREEGFASNLAEKIPIVGAGVRGSGRGYVGFLNKFRADAFDHYLQMAQAEGRDITDPELLKSISRWINHATGRGSMKSVEGAMVPLTHIFFSPRLIKSRLNLMNPKFYKDLDPFARKQALRGMSQLAGGIGLTLGIAEMAGLDVVKDPRNADFGKIKFGNTRVDLAGGFSQYLVAAAKIQQGESISSASGELTHLEGGFGKKSRFSVGTGLLENKLAPVMGYGVDWMKNENFAGEKFNQQGEATIPGTGGMGLPGDRYIPYKETGRLFLPLPVETAFEGYKEGPTAFAASTGLGGIGFGVQTYGPRAPRAKAKPPRQRYMDEQRDNAKVLGQRTVPEEIKKAVKLKALIEVRLDQLEKEQKSAKNAQVPEGKRFKLTSKQRAAVLIDVLGRNFSEFDTADAKSAIRGLSDRNIESVIDRWRSWAYSDLLEKYGSMANRVRDARSG